jgi:septal ring factor EnvC (AmiA/AmiB activator)
MLAIGRGPITAGGATGALTIVLVLLAMPPASAASSRQDVARQGLRDAERQRNEQRAIGKGAADRALQAAAEAQRLASERVATAEKVQQADLATRDVAARIDALAETRRDAERRLKARAVAMQPLLPLIERLSLYPVETLLAVPETPEATLRGVMVLKGLSRQIEVEAEALRREQTDLDAASQALEAEMPRLVQARAEQSREAAVLDQQIASAHAERAAAEADAGQATSQAAAAASRMDTLRAALNVLEAQERSDASHAREAAERAARQQQPAEEQVARQATLSRPARGAPGRLQPPVVGVLVKQWGQATDGGPATGVSYFAPPAARVVSPCGGRVVFADLFRSYGLLLIIDCGGGYHVVLSGFDRLDVRLGQSLVVAEPVGIMPGWEPGSTARRPSLYVELRHDGQPVNPAPWLRSSG